MDRFGLNFSDQKSAFSKENVGLTQYKKWKPKFNGEGMQCHPELPNVLLIRACRSAVNGRGGGRVPRDGGGRVAAAHRGRRRGGAGLAARLAVAERDISYILTERLPLK